MRNGKAHGVFLPNSDGMDIKIAKTDEGEQYLNNNINGSALKLVFLTGPTPSAVSQQYSGIVGTVSLSFLLKRVMLMTTDKWFMEQAYRT